MSEVVNHNVFLSYSRDDLQAAKLVQQELESKGIKVWRDQDSIYGGERWPQAIGEGIAGKSLFVLLWSAMASKSHYVEFEWNTALALRKKILPILLDQTELPPSLKAIHGITLDTIRDPGFLRAPLNDSLKEDLDLRQSVLHKLKEIPDDSPEKVLEAAKILFHQEGWKVKGNIYQIHGGNVTINATQEADQKPNKWNVWGKSGWLAIAALPILLLVGLLIPNNSTAPVEEFVLTINFRGPQVFPENHDLGKARLRLGSYLSPIKEILDNEVIFNQIPGKYLKDTVKLDLVSQDYTIVDQSAFTPDQSKRITFQVRPVITYLSIGGVVYDSGQRIDGAIVEIDRGLARDTTDLEGKFDLTLPKKEGEFALLSVIYQGRERYRREVMIHKKDLNVTLDPL
ncbi:MAG: toll/interleukin-1 receptor domain-containing protein [Cyclobacteriaceae bacterium]